MPGQLPGAAERGATRIADRVVSKIAAYAAYEALGGAPEGGSRPRASVHVRQETARVRVAVELDYPTDVGARCRAVRSRVAGRVRQLAGMAVPEVTVEVERLHSDDTRGTAGRRVA
ncbi:Asp23/Gls24 family envelope stress response protein [Streptomyces sp. NPDC050560]|uniref:Asp23/Gls24 family envelope stress response protein n=1 Tax=Streptomyces sp. NPDC050560 TaxID=3365630 RepID=UPI0037A68862